MISPNCPDHGRLVLDLALGRLDDAAAMEAESISESCPICRAWWREQFESETAAVVDEAVAAGFSDLRLPERRRGHRWMAAAAAVIMTLGVGSLWVAQRTAPVEEAAPPRVASIQTITFEPSDATEAFAMVEAPDPAPAAVPTAQESAAEELVVADAVQVEVVADRQTGALFAGGFETGDLGEWEPKT